MRDYDARYPDEAQIRSELRQEVIEEPDLEKAVASARTFLEGGHITFEGAIYRREARKFCHREDYDLRILADGGT